MSEIPAMVPAILMLMILFFGFMFWKDREVFLALFLAMGAIFCSLILLTYLFKWIGFA